MKRRTATIRQLSTEYDLDRDESLLMLWDAGLDYEDVDEQIRQTDLQLVYKALGISPEKAQHTVDYWCKATGLGRPELVAALREHRIPISPEARRLPKSTLRKVRRVFGTPIAAGNGANPEPCPEPIAPLVWEPVGQVQDIAHLATEDVQAIHQDLELEFANSPDPMSPPGGSYNLLDSAMNRPNTGLGSKLKYPTVEMAGAALFHSLIHDHPFHNGNKRTAIVALLAFLDQNGLVLNCNKSELFRFTLRTAKHDLVPDEADDFADREVFNIACWIRSHSQPLDKREHPMKWVRLKQRLREYGCEFSTPSVGHRLNITREMTVRETHRFRRPTTRTFTLAVQVQCGGDGTDAARSTIHRIRRELWLDDHHDVDSNDFYQGKKIDSFIIEYRRILRRLAKL